MDRGVGSDAELVARARDGDLDAFDRLIARHRHRVFGIAQQIAGNPEAAQDIAQEGFLSAFRSLHTLGHQDRFGLWLNTIVRREAQRWLRRREPRWEPMDAETLRGVPGWLWQSEPEPPGELVERLGLALRILSQRDRNVMILHYLEGHSCQEIAERLHISVGSVKRILHYSRQKARKESEEMASAEKQRGGPRRLIAWVDGSPGEGRGNVFERLRYSLAQTVCLAVNKTAKTAQQISEEVGTHPGFVGETAADLLDAEVLVSPRKGKYLANFIAFEAADWRRLMGLVRQPAARVAEQLANSQARLQSALEKTPLAASGWAWTDMAWSMHAVLVANTGASRNQPATSRLPRPERAGGGRYWLGGREEVRDLAPVWCTGFNSYGWDPHSPLRHGYFWTWGMDRQHARELGPGWSTLLGVFADGPLTEAQALTRLEGDRERLRAILADLVKLGFLKRANGQFRLTIPVFAQGDSDVLTPEIDDVIRPVIEEVVVPALADVDHLLDEMAYDHRREQYPQWHRWLTSNVMGEALRFLMEQSVLPRPDDPAPPTFAFIAWKGDLPLMSWGIE